MMDQNFCSQLTHFMICVNDGTTINRSPFVIIKGSVPLRLQWEKKSLLDFLAE